MNDTLPKYRSHTIRQTIIDLLHKETLGARDLSRILGIKEKEVYEHLAHISRSMMVKNKKLKILPAKCLLCGYTFKERKRYTRPGRCPMCKKSHIEAPMYVIT